MAIYKHDKEINDSIEKKKKKRYRGKKKDKAVADRKGGWVTVQ